MQLELEGIHKSFGSKEVLKGVSFNSDRGKSTACPDATAREKPHCFTA